MSGGIGQTPASTGADEELRQYEPIYSGPPEKPEYYMLYKKNGARELTGLKINNFIIEDKAREERHEALRKLRREYYCRLFPERNLVPSKAPDPLEWNAGISIPREYVPGFDIYKKDIPPKGPIEVVRIPGGNAADLRTVSVEWKDIIEEVAPGECEFFPYEFRLRDGSLIRTRYAIRCLAPYFRLPYSPKKTGFERMRWNDGPRAGEYYWYDAGPNSPSSAKIYAGQVVLCRSAVKGSNIIFSDSKYFVSARLYERLKDLCGRHYAFYPLHIDEEC